MCRIFYWHPVLDRDNIYVFFQVWNAEFRYTLLYIWNNFQFILIFHFISSKDPLAWLPYLVIFCLGYSFIIVFTFDSIFPNGPFPCLNQNNSKSINKPMLCITSLISYSQKIYIRQRDPSLSLGGLDPRLEVVLMFPLWLPPQPWENYRALTTTTFHIKSTQCLTYPILKASSISNISKMHKQCPKLS